MEAYISAADMMNTTGGGGSGSGGGSSSGSNKSESENSGESDQSESEQDGGSDKSEGENSSESDQSESEQDGGSDKSESENSSESGKSESEQDGGSDKSENENSSESGKSESEQESGSDKSESENSGESGKSESEQDGESDKSESENSGESDQSESEQDDESDKSESENSGESDQSESEQDGESDKSENENSSESGKSESKQDGESDKSENENSSESDQSESEQDGKSDQSESENSSGSDKSEDKREDVAAAISYHQVFRVMASKGATPSDAEQTDEDAATPSNASSSNANKNKMEFELYQPVRLNGDGAVAFRITMEELGLNNELEKNELASPSNASMYFEEDLDGFFVQAEAEAGVFPKGTRMVVTELKEDDTETAQMFQEAKEAMDQNGESYDGMMALDICFYNEEGEEIEPDGNVYVAIRMDAEMLPEEADPSTLSVQHIKEESGGQAKVEAVADTKTKTTGTVEVQDGEKVVAEFAVDSFSYFVIAYGNYDGNKGVKVYLVDENKAPIPGDDNDELNFSNGGIIRDPADLDEKKELKDKWISIESLADTYARKTKGYQYVSAHLNSIDGTDIRWVKYDSNDPGRWRYSESKTQPKKTDTGEALYETTTYTPYNIYLVYKKINTVVQEGDLQIIDEVSESGNLAAVYKKDDSNIEYHWFKEDENAVEGWTEVKYTEITGDSSNITEDGKKLNVLLDKGAGKKYKVQVWSNDTNTKQESKPFQVPYYDELKNGSFEDPKVWDINPGGSNFQYPAGTEGLIWQTTGDDQQIEIARINADGGKTQSDYNCNETAEGDQFAELNAEAAGALYQDVMTWPGSELHWGLSHRGRNGSDTMYLVIAPTKLVKNITTQEQLTDWIANNRKTSGVTVIDVTSGKSWNSKTGKYEVPSKQYLTRFFFVAGKTASGNDTVGNLLDDVWFSTTWRPPTYRLTVKKQVGGNMGEKHTPFEFKYVITSGGQGQEETGTITLSHDQSATIKVPKDAKVVITETSGEGYTTTARVTGGIDGTYEDADKAFTIEHMTASGTVTFTNIKKAIPATGVRSHKLPYLMLLSVALLATAGMSLDGARRRVRKDRDED